MLSRPNDSVSGALEVRPAFFIRAKAGDSFRLSRIHTEMISRKNDSRNGSRHQPLLANASSPTQVRVPRITSSAMKRPTVAVVWIQDVK